jgi:voltage-gated potassium channel
MIPDGSLLRIGMLMIVATGVIQVVAQLVLSHMMDVLPSPPQSRYPRFYMLTHSVTAVVILMIGHILQVAMWALVYHYHWGEFVNLKSALYFSLASFTTLGATDLALPPDHRMIGALEAAAGMLMFGWSTALLVSVVQRTDRHPRL